MEYKPVPPSWANWIQYNAGKPAIAINEFILYSDAWFIDEARERGPYSFLNPVPLVQLNETHQLKPALVLRVQQHLKFQVGDMTKTEDAHYHAGTLYDEISALVSLVLGVRIATGPIVREFTGKDPLGVPRTHGRAFTPTLLLSPNSPQIPSLLTERNLKDLRLLDRFPELGQAEAIMLVKSARLFQQALWFADAAPELSWLLLVSAVETAAEHWDAKKRNPVEAFELIYPKLANRLRENPDGALLNETAKQLEGLVGSTAKFKRFMEQFQPQPPKPRPKLYSFDFSKQSYTSAMTQIYRYRSKALHGGTPFPHPMCEPPRRYSADDELNEIPMGLGASALGATWVKEDTPMLLHLFSFIVQHALVLWWEDLASRS